MCTQHFVQLSAVTVGGNKFNSQFSGFGFLIGATACIHPSLLSPTLKSGQIEFLVPIDAKCSETLAKTKRAYFCPKILLRHISFPSKEIVKYATIYYRIS